MTNEEAIDVLKRNYPSSCFEELCKAVDIAINALSAQQEQRWIPIKSRPMDEEERKEWGEKLSWELTDDEAVIFVSQLPDDGQTVLVCKRYGDVSIDEFYSDSEDGCYFEENGDMDGIVAWMPLPKPYKGEES